MASDPDLDNLDSVSTSEERIFEEGFADGMKAGEVEGWEEGWSAGLSQGGRIGLELGTFEGFCTKVLESIEESTNPHISPEEQERNKLSKLCHTLIDSVHKFPTSNVEGQDLMLLVSEIRGQFSVIKNLLNMSNISQISAKESFSF